MQYMHSAFIKYMYICTKPLWNFWNLSGINGVDIYARKRRHLELDNYSVHMTFYCNDIWISAGILRLQLNFYLPSD